MVMPVFENCKRSYHNGKSWLLYQVGLVKKYSMSKKAYILDTNVLIHDPESIFHFQENEVIIPFEALEELDKLKNGMTRPATMHDKLSDLSEALLKPAV